MFSQDMKEIIGGDGDSSKASPKTPADGPLSQAAAAEGKKVRWL